jgi:hypothetical protein
MAATTRYNGSFGNYATGTLRSVLQLKAFVIDAGGDLQAQDSDSAGEVDQAVEAVVREVQPLMYFTPSAGDGLIHVIVDGHAVDADTLQARIRAMGTVNGYSLTGATVTLGTSIVVAG